MFGRYQRRLAMSTLSLHTIVVAVVVLWLIAGGMPTETVYNDSGLWHLVPDGVRNDGWFNTLMALFTVACSIYVLAELNVSHVLLRLNSRAISIVFAALFLMFTDIHAFGPGYVVMFLMLLACFSLFSCYQLENSSSFTYVTFLYLGISFLLIPQMLWMAIIFWLSLYLLHTINVKSLCASVLGLFTPVWLVGCIAFCINRMNLVWDLFVQSVNFHFSGFASWNHTTWISVGLLFLIWLVSIGDFYSRAYLDKNRTRTLFQVIALHGVAYFLLLVLSPANINLLLPIIILNTSIMGGHYVANDQTQLSNTLVWIATVGIVMMFILNGF